MRDLQRQRFGAGGDLDKKRQELLKPVEDRVYSTIERIANEKNYAFVFDRAGSATILFASEKYDLSDQVLEMLGYKPGDAKAAKTDKDKSDRSSTNRSSDKGSKDRSSMSERNNSSGKINDREKKYPMVESNSPKQRKY